MLTQGQQLHSQCQHSPFQRPHRASRVPFSPTARMSGTGRPLKRPAPESVPVPNDTTTPNQPVPLKYVVQEAVKRWFEDTLQEAQRGDVKASALLGQMYLEGYGTGKDTKTGKEWIDKAAAKGYRMQGVYCEL